MTIQAQSADGVMHEFPDGTEGAVIDRVMKQYAQQQGAAAGGTKAGEQMGAAGAQRADAASAGEQLGADVGKTPFRRGALGEPRTLSQVQYEDEPVGEPGAMIPLAQGARTGRMHAAVPAVVAEPLAAAGRAGRAITGQDPNYSQQQLEEDARTLAAATAGGSVVKAGAAKALAPAELRGAKGAAEALRAGGVETAGKTAGEEAGKALAAKAAPPPEAVVEAQQRLADAQSRTKALARSYQETGIPLQQQRVLLAQAERHAQDAQAGVAQLEQNMLQNRGMTADEFGAQVRQVTQDMADKYGRIRSNQAGYKQAIDSAGDAPRVPTEPAHAIIDEYLKNVANPSLKTQLKNLTQTFGGAPDELAGPRGITVRQADSARKYLDSIIQSKQLGDQAIDAETANVLKQVKRSLVDGATQAWPPYRQALARWRMLSRPLDIVERNGALRKVIDRDPVSTDYKLTEAEVAHQVISRARAGNPTLLRLASEDAGFKDAARLYFTQDLFGKEAVPTNQAMRTWLRKNEAPLKQLKLYDEFRDLRVARETAQRAVDDAKENVGRAAGEVKLAEQRRAKAQQQAKMAEAGQRAAQKRAEGEQRKADAEKERRVISSTKRASEYQKFESDIRTARPREVPGEVRKLTERLYNDGRLSQQQYEAAEKQIQQVENSQAAQAAKVARYKQIARAALYAGAGTYAGYKFGKAISGL